MVKLKISPGDVRGFNYHPSYSHDALEVYENGEKGLDVDVSFFWKKKRPCQEGLHK